MLRGYLLLLACLTLAACTKQSETPQNAAAPDAGRGKAIYLSNCVACHNADPSRDGPIGPAIKGSTPALIEARVLKAGYPPGYKPKRNTSIMPALPYLKTSIPDLAAFLH